MTRMEARRCGPEGAEHSVSSEGGVSGCGLLLQSARVCVCVCGEGGHMRWVHHLVWA